MRTGPFSSQPVIDRLNARFVPVYAVNEDYRAPGVVSPAERAEYRRVFREAGEKKFSVGTVHVYVLAPGGEVLGSRHVAEASKTKALVAFLDGVSARLGTAPGAPACAPRPQSVAPAVAPGGLALHLTVRKLGARGSWDGTGEDWVTYTPAEARAWVPAAVNDAAPVALDAALTWRLLRHVYPVSENNDPAANRILSSRLTAKVLARGPGATRLRLDGYLVMRHDFYHKPDGNVVRAALRGTAELDPRTGAVTALTLVSDGATYNGGRFAALVESE